MSVFVSLLEICTFTSSLFTFGLLMNEEGLKRRDSVGSLSVIIFRINGWLTQGSIIYVEKAMIGFLSCFCLCECTCLLYFKEVLGQKARIALQAVSASIYSLIDLTCLFCFKFP